MRGESFTNSVISVTNLRPDDTEANPFWYTFKVQCTSCRETHQNWVGVSRFVSDRSSIHVDLEIS